MLVVSAVEGVQAQTRILMRALQRLHIPTVVFVNKVDRRGARDTEVVGEIRDRLTSAAVPLGSVADIGSRAATATPWPPPGSGWVAGALEVLTGNDQALLSAYVDDEASITPRRLRRALARQTRQCLAHPVLMGSAMTGAGVEALSAALVELLPAPAGDPDAPVAGTVFKVARGPSGERVAYARLTAGTLRTRDVVAVGPHRTAKVTAIGVFDDGAVVPAAAVTAGRIAQVWGLGEVRVGDPVGAGQAAAGPAFARPTLETVVVPWDDADRGALQAALGQLAEQDPLIDVRQDDERREISVSLYGEVQKEVVQATLADDYGLAVTFRETTPICVERPVGTGAAFEIIDTDTNPFLATVGLRVEPAAVGSGVDVRLEVELGSMPIAFFRAVEEAVHDTLRQGVHGWQVPDAVVTVTHSGYWPRQSHAHGTFDKSMSSTAGDFRNLTPLVLMTALTARRHRGAGTTARLPPRAADRHPGRCPARTRAVGGGAAPHRRARRPVGPHRRGPRGRGARAHPGAARPHPRGRSAGGGPGPLPAGARCRPGATSFRSRPEGPEDVPPRRRTPCRRRRGGGLRRKGGGTGQRTEDLLRRGACCIWR